jgi:hypothetical protein
MHIHKESRRCMINETIAVYCIVLPLKENSNIIDYNDDSITFRC